MSLVEYLERVRAESQQIQISKQLISSYEQRKSEPRLQFSPSLFGSVGYSDEKSLGTNGVQQPGDSNKAFTQGVGVQKEWGSGTNTAVQHIIRRNDIEGIPGLTSAFWTNQIELKLEQDIWRNFLGRELRNEVKAATEFLSASAQRERFQIESTLATAEKLYWQVALAQQISVSIQDSLKRTDGILNYNRKRLKLNIIDKGDLLQSEAAVLRLKQQLEDSRTREQEAKRQLQILVSTLDVSEFQTDNLVIPLEQVEVPANWNPESRGDLQALAHIAEAEAADATAKSSSMDPQLNLVASYSGNSLDNSFGEAEKQIFKDDFRRYEVGLQLNVPLSFGKLSDVKAAEKHEFQSARLKYELGQRELDVAFENLRGQIQEVLNKLKFAQELEKTQREKLQNEDGRYRQGRSSSFQLLTFEEDLAGAELEVLTLYARLRSLLADAKLFQ